MPFKFNPLTGQLDLVNTSSGAGGGTPGGSDTQVQFNDSGSFGGDSDFTYNKTTNALTVAGQVNAVSASITGQYTQSYSTPVSLIQNTAGATDGKNWISAVSTTHYLAEIMSDDLATSNVWLDVNRSTTAISSIKLRTGAATGTDALTLDSSQKATFAGHLVVEGVTSTGATGTGKFVFDTSPTIVTPTIASFANANHNHTNSAGGGTLTHSAVSDFDTQVRTSTLNQMTAPTADLSINSHKLTSVTDPTSAQDAATKAYVDAVAQGLAVKGSVLLATAAALPTNTYLANVITVTATGTLTIDGTVVSLNDRVLVKDEASQLKNGVYTVTTAGAVGVAAVLTRSADMDASAEFPGAFVFAETGTVNAAAGFVCTNSTPPTVGTTAITFTQFSGAGEITAGNGLGKSANTLSIDTSITVDKTTAQTLTNKTLTAPTISTLAQTGAGTADSVLWNNNAITATSNAATIPVTKRLSTVTNNSAATLTITLTTSGATDGQLVMVRVYDFSAAAQTLTWVNTENSTVPVPTTTNGSTTLPLTIGFMYNGATSKYRCIAVA